MTAEGRIIYEYSRRMVKLRNDAKEKILALQKNTGGEIYLAASTIPATYILPRALSVFRKQHSDIRVHIKTADSEDAMNMVLDNELEMGCIGKKPQNRKLRAEPLWKDRLILAVPKNHRWVHKKIISMKELSEEPFIIREKGSATREVLETYLKEKKALNFSQLANCVELGSSEAIKEAIIAGLGVSVISVHAVARELASGLLCEVPVAGLKLERNFYLIYQIQSDFRRAHKIFIDFIKDYIPD